jgi:hypothetical protein
MSDRLITKWIIVSQATEIAVGLNQADTAGLIKLQ